MPRLPHNTHSAPRLHLSRPIAFLAICSLLVVAPAVAVERDQYGEEHVWRGELGSYTVIDFAASWCAPCFKTLPKLVELGARYPELRILVVSVDDRVAGRDELVERLGLEVPVLWDEDYAIAEHYKPPAMPTTYLLSPDGEIVHSHVGSGDVDWERFVTKVEDLFASELAAD